MVVSAVATIASEIGTVASDGRGAISRGDDAAEDDDDSQAGGAQHLGGSQHEYIAQRVRGSGHGGQESREIRRGSVRPAWVGFQLAAPR